MFRKHDITVQFAEEMNLWSVQRKGASTNTTNQKIEQNLQMCMAITDFPTYWMYWANDTRYPLIVDILPRNSYPLADIFPRNRYQNLCELLHVNGNSKKYNPKNAGNELHKVKSVLGQVRNNCILIDLRKTFYRSTGNPSKDKTQWIVKWSQKNCDFRNQVGF